MVPLITVAIACVLNIAGDLILVALFRMGAAGAAIATVSAQAVSVLISLVIIRRRELPFAFSVKDIRVNGMYLKKIRWLGILIALQDLLANISFLVILAIMNGLGLIVSAGVGVAEKMCGFLMLVASAYMQSMSAFVAQNIGARGVPSHIYCQHLLMHSVWKSILNNIWFDSKKLFAYNVLVSDTNTKRKGHSLWRIQ